MYPCYIFSSNSVIVVILRYTKSIPAPYFRDETRDTHLTLRARQMQVRIVGMLSLIELCYHSHGPAPISSSKGYIPTRSCQHRLLVPPQWPGHSLIVILVHHFHRKQGKATHDRDSHTCIPLSHIPDCTAILHQTLAHDSRGPEVPSTDEKLAFFLPIPLATKLGRPGSEIPSLSEDGEAQRCSAC